MDFSNAQLVKKLRIVFLVLGSSWLFTVSVLIFLSFFTGAVIMAGLFLLTILFIAILNFHYIRISVVKEKLTLRYYSIFAVDRMFKLIEFPVNQLRRVDIRSYFFGLKYEVRLTVRVKMGIADYPWVSLSGISRTQRIQLIKALKGMALQKSEIKDVRN